MLRVKPKNARREILTTQWSKDLGKHTNDDPEKIAELVDTFTNKTVARMNSLEIFADTFDGFHDRTAKKSIGFNSVKIIMAEEMCEAYKRECDDIDFPLPNKTECLSVIEIILLEYRNYANTIIKRHNSGKELDANVSVIPI